jgi:hypothetical protein
MSTGHANESAMRERPIGPYRHDVIEATGIYVSTIFRESSAMQYGSPYFETMAWLDAARPPRILWQSAAGYERAADRMHDLAVRWFSRAAAGPTDSAPVAAANRTTVSA